MESSIVVLFGLYFIQGLPYGLQAGFMPIYLRTKGSSLAHVSAFKLLLAPWFLKGTWAPLVDRYGTKMRWLRASVAAMCVACCALAATDPGDSSFAALIFALNVFSATQDVAVDGVAMQTLSASELGAGNTAQVVGYKVGAAAAGLLGVVEARVGWTRMFLMLSAIYAVSYALLSAFEPKNVDAGTSGVASPKSSEQSFHGDQSEIADACQRAPGKESWESLYRSLLHTDGTLWVATFVLTYKLGEQGAISLMPLFLVDSGMSSSRVTFWCGILGMTASIAGSFWGGHLVTNRRIAPAYVALRHCTLRIIPMLAMLWVTWSMHLHGSLSILEDFSSLAGLCLLHFHGGVVTTATFTLMMQCSRNAPPRCQATHYTLLATAEVLGKMALTVALGGVAETCGYVPSLALALLLSVYPLYSLRSCPSAFLDG
ncbi:PREDICTED: major facilitator superfamily domain-containing protein 3-like [Priapulus caudatus]|uniref:Major facilitator superfamily domain-containing protein 3-like n=1 Tax=Priapulus caudatus TaxID=37621 RepID=A0ABM1DVA2_PRICU|nr:PREDICTED: major facilitator superfamily domain-containing protein 3-like [Priapulus caudatus]